jgi:hypothetical protein
MSSKDEVQPLLEMQSPEVRALAQRLREVIQAVQPDLVEDASIRLKVIYYRYRGVVCALGLHKNHVNLHFYKGTRLDDPEGLLQGGGKDLRHLNFQKFEDIRPEIIKGMIKEAYALNH